MEIQIEALATSKNDDTLIYMKILSLLAALSFIFLVSFLFWKGHKPHCRIPTSSGVWNLEVVRTAKGYAQGLMGRKKLCSSCGMLFVFRSEKNQTFWMKDMLIPLDIYFYDKNNNLVDKVINMRPENETKDPMMYHSKAPAQYVLEVNHGSLWNLDSLPLNCLN